MRDAITFRLASLDDLPSLAQMRWDNRLEARPNGLSVNDLEFEQELFLGNCLRFLEDAQASGRWAMWVAAAPDGSLVSSAFVQSLEKVPRPFNHHARWGYLTNVYTRPEWRGQGISARLLEQVKEWSRQQGLELLLLWPSQKSQDLYQRLGFRAPTGMLTIELNPYEEFPL